VAISYTTGMIMGKVSWGIDHNNNQAV